MFKQLSLALAFLMIIVPAEGQTFGSPTSYRIGGETIVVPTPANFLETSKSAPEMWASAKLFNTASVRLLAHYAPESEVKAFLAGSEVRLSQYMYVHTPLGAEGVTTTQAQFDKLRMRVLALQNEIETKLAPKLKDELARASKGLSTLQDEPFSVKVNEVVPLSIDRNDAKALVYTTLMSLKSSQGDTAYDGNIIGVSALIYSKGKVLTLTVNRLMKSPRDIQVVRSFAGEWVAAIVAAN